ncbi:MAG: 16S rRNA (adenine(1518)-N(6)/adenine(1519)-N(6))-dimethyltransferase RsmA [Bacilli bacterium]
MEHKAQKQYGQNFLVNEDICRIISSYLSNEVNNVLEVGPGLGALTKYLAKKYTTLTGVEIDRNLYAKLVIEYPNVKFINDNIKKIDISSYDLIVGNIPYNITTELILKCIKEGTTAQEIVFMVQEEAYKRIVIAKDKTEHTPLSTLINMYFNQSLLLRVNRSEFNPRPHVDSVVFKLEKKKEDLKYSPAEIYSFLLILYSSRRKNILNNLIKKFNKDKLKEILLKLNVPENLRAEDLTNLQIVSLYSELVLK